MKSSMNSLLRGSNFLDSENSQSTTQSLASFPKVKRGRNLLKVGKAKESKKEKRERDTTHALFFQEDVCSEIPSIVWKTSIINLEGCYKFCPSADDRLFHTI